MSLQKLMSNNAEYNVWANQQFVNWLSAKSDELLYKEVPSSYSSIIKTLNHIWSSQEYWWGMIAQTTDIDNRFQKIESFLSHIQVHLRLKQDYFLDRMALEHLKK